MELSSASFACTQLWVKLMPLNPLMNNKDMNRSFHYCLNKLMINWPNLTKSKHNSYQHIRYIRSYRYTKWSKMKQIGAKWSKMNMKWIQMKLDECEMQLNETKMYLVKLCFFTWLPMYIFYGDQCLQYYTYPASNYFLT